MSEIDAAQLVKFHAGSVLLRGPEGEYVDDYTGFAADSGRSVPELPTGAIGLVYIPKEKYSIVYRRMQDPQRLPWGPGDDLLERLAVLLENQEARKAVEPSPEPSLNELLLGAMNALIDERAAEPNPPQAITDYVDARDERGGV